VLEELFTAVSALSAPAVVGIDGAGGTGKTFLGTWLATELGALAYDVDSALAGDGTLWNRDVIRLNVAAAVKARRLVVVSGSCLLELLESRPDLLIVMQEDPDLAVVPCGFLQEHVACYLNRVRPENLADFVLCLVQAKENHRVSSHGL
jgi:hypothetical protein